MNELTINIHISKEELLKYYQGSAQYVSTSSEDGRIVQFPANRLHPYIGHNGVRGRFRLCYDDQGKLLSFECIY